MSDSRKGRSKKIWIRSKEINFYIVFESGIVRDFNVETKRSEYPFKLYQQVFNRNAEIEHLGKSGTSDQKYGS